VTMKDVDVYPTEPDHRQTPQEEHIDNS